MKDRGAISLFLVSDILCSFPAKDAGGAFVWNTKRTPSDKRLGLQKHLAVAFKQTTNNNNQTLTCKVSSMFVYSLKKSA